MASSIIASPHASISLVRISLSLLILTACAGGTVSRQPSVPPAKPDSTSEPSATVVSRRVPAFQNGAWPLTVTAISVSTETSADSAAVDTTNASLRGTLSIRLDADSGLATFDADSASTRSTGRTRFPRHSIWRELPSYRLRVSPGRIDGAFAPGSSTCLEDRGDQLASAFLPLPLLLPRATFARDWTDSTHAETCLGGLPLRMLIVTRYTARPILHGVSLDTVLIQRVSTMTATLTTAMDSVPVEIRLFGTSSGQGSLPVLAQNSPERNPIITFADTVHVDVSFRSRYRDQRIVQQTVRTTIITMSVPERNR